MSASISYYWALPKPGQHIYIGVLAVAADIGSYRGVTRIISGGPFTPGISTTDNADITGASSERARVFETYSTFNHTQFRMCMGLQSSIQRVIMLIPGLSLLPAFAAQGKSSFHLA